MEGNQIYNIYLDALHGTAKHIPQPFVNKTVVETKYVKVVKRLKHANSPSPAWQQNLAIICSVTITTANGMPLESQTSLKRLRDSIFLRTER